jgi:PKD repeat protein
MSNNLSNFDQSIRKSIDGFDAPYDANSWSAMSSKLDAASSSSSSNYLWAAVAAAGLFAATGIYLYYHVQNAACEASLVGTTMKIERGTAYDGVAMKMKDSILSGGIAGVEVENGLDESIVHNQSIGAQDLAMNANDGSSTDLNTSSKDNSNSNAVGSDVNNSNKANWSVIDGGNATDNSEKVATAKVESKASTKDEVANENALAFAPSLSEACVGVEVTFDLQTGDVNGSYLWNFGDGNFSNAPNPTHKFAKSGSYDISLSVTSQDDGKIRSTTMKEMILINPKPNADFEWEFVNSPGHEPQVSFKNTSEMATDCHWVFDEKNTSTEINPSTSYDSKGRHVVLLSAENEFGCIDEKYAYISIDSDYNLLAQETMTPGVEGPQGVFMPLGLKKKDVDFKLTVYDNKQPIFESTNKFKPWDGQLPGGEFVESGSYPWVVIIYNRYGEEEKYYSGTITITP